MKSRTTQLYTFTKITLYFYFFYYFIIIIILLLLLLSKHLEGLVVVA